MIKHVSALLLAGVALTAGCSAKPDPRAGNGKPSEPPKVAIVQTTFQGLTEAVKDHQGKIVVIDMWGTFCVPCREEFHNLVEIHRDHAKEGVVCMSVAVDPSDEKQALKFLEEQKAAFPNFLLNEAESSKLQENWGFGAVPAVFVFDRAGKRHDFTLDDPNKQFTYNDVKTLLGKLLQK